MLKGSSHKTISSYIEDGTESLLILWSSPKGTPW